MIQNTFIHIAGIGPKTEQDFWAAGVEDWDAFSRAAGLKLSAAKKQRIADALDESRRG